MPRVLSFGIRSSLRQTTPNKHPTSGPVKNPGVDLIQTSLREHAPMTTDGSRMHQIRRLSRVPDGLSEVSSPLVTFRFRPGVSLIQSSQRSLARAPHRRARNITVDLSPLLLSSMVLHLVCRGNTHRSRLAEAYANSRTLDVDEITILSSGIEADFDLNGPIMPFVKVLLGTRTAPLHR